MKYISFLSALVLFCLMLPGQSTATTPSFNSCGIGGGYNAHCGMWLCLPGGFRNGCKDQRTAFFKRVSRFGCSPLPSYFSCTGGQGTQSAIGETFETCKDNYSLKVSGTNDGRDFSTGTCDNTDKKREKRRRTRDGEDVDRSRCGDYSTPKVNFIDITIDGEKQPRYTW
jgi:hypothetical protein